MFFFFKISKDFLSDFDFKPRIGEHVSNCQSKFFTRQFVKRNTCAKGYALCDVHVSRLMRMNWNADDWFCEMNRFNDARCSFLKMFMRVKCGILFQMQWKYEPPCVMNNLTLPCAKRACCESHGRIITLVVLCDGIDICSRDLKMMRNSWKLLKALISASFLLWSNSEKSLLDPNDT